MENTQKNKPKISSIIMSIIACVLLAISIFLTIYGNYLALTTSGLALLAIIFVIIPAIWLPNIAILIINVIILPICIKKFSDFKKCQIFSIILLVLQLITFACNFLWMVII